VEKVFYYFLLRDYKWKFKDGDKRLPSKDDLREMIERCADFLARDQSEQVTIESGRLLIKRDKDIFDVYVHVGEFR